MRVLNKKNSRVNPLNELAAMTLIENLINNDKKAASETLRQMVVDNISKRSEKISKTEPLI